MVDKHLKSASQALNATYRNVFKPSALTNTRSLDPVDARRKRNQFHRTRATLILGNFFTLGLANVYWLARGKKIAETQELNGLLRVRAYALAESVAAGYGLQAKDLADYLLFRMHVLNSAPGVTPSSDPAFAFGWQEFRQDNAEQLKEWGIT